MNVMIVVQCKPDLFEMVLAFGSSRSFASLLHGRQKQSDEDCDDCNHDKQFNQREATPKLGVLR